MAERTYIITLDPFDSRIDIEGLKTAIRDGAAFAKWWNHIPSVFLVTSDRNAEAIADQIQTFANGASTLVMEVNPAESQGWLPATAWQWITNRARRPETTIQHASD